MATKVLRLWLEGPLQSWGDRSLFSQRETRAYPTKSGVTGLLFAAMGLKGAQEKRLAELADLRMEVFALDREHQQPTVALEDFQMIGNGYDDSDPWEVLMIPKTSEGKKAVNGGAKLTYRQYLQDASFVVLFEMPQAMAEQAEAALKNPVWDLYLGRKCCAPSQPIYFGLFSSFEEAATDLSSKLQQPGEFTQFKVRSRLVDACQSDWDAEVVYDVPVVFGAHKKYKERYVKEIYLNN